MLWKFIKQISTFVFLISPLASLACANPSSQIATNESTRKNADDKALLQLLSSKPLNSVAQDGLYLLKDYYNGTMYDYKRQYQSSSSSVAASNFYTPIPSNRGFSDNVIQMQKGDALFMIYDNDDNDGVAPNNFVDTVTFNDTSLAISDDIKDINLAIGAIKGYKSWLGFAYQDIKFIADKSGHAGALAKYVGSQSNHLSQSWSVAMQRMKEQLSPVQYQAIVNYYQLASHIFKPQVIGGGMFTFQKIGQRAVKITLVQDVVITGARFRITPIISGNEQPSATYGIYSIGQEDFAAYNKGNYRFIGKYDEN